MAAESNRRGAKISGLVVRPQAISDKSYVESVVGFIHDVVPQGKQDDKEAILWVKFEYADINDLSTISDENQHNGNNPPLLLILGYISGVQIWCVPANGEAQEVLSWRQGPVRMLRILPTPQPVFNSQDLFSTKRPLVALCDSTSAGQQFCAVSFISLKTGDQCQCVKFKNPVIDIQCNKRVLAVTFQERIAVFDACTFKELFAITSCYPCPGPNANPIALGTRWLAFADRKLVSLHQTCGGMAGDGVQSYAATVIHAAKTITKGLTMFGETVASSLTGHKGHQVVNSNKKDPKAIEHVQPGIVTIIDVQTAGTGEVNIDEDSEGEGIIAHFPAHSNDPVAALSFDPSGMLLFTACRLGHNFHIFRVFPHPASSSLGAVHHLYTLHRGDTTAKVQDVAFSLDSRWVAVSTLRGTTHIFPITPYGGPVSVRTHTSPRVVNRMSRFHKSAGLEDIQHPPSTGRNSPVLSGSPGSSGSCTTRSYDSHPSVPYHNTVSGRMGNPRLPPYPHPTTIHPLAQLKQPLTFPLTGSGQPKSPSGKERSGRRTSSGPENISVSAIFAPPRAWLVGSPSLARDKREKRPMDSLFVIGWHGNLVEYSLEPKAASGAKAGDDSPVELEVTAHAQWTLLRPVSAPEMRPPLPPSNPLMITQDMMSLSLGGKERKQSTRRSISVTIEEGGESNEAQLKSDELEESWLSQVEIITHAGPHRRLWMGPQFSFKTFQHSANTTVLSSTSSALLSQSPESPPSSSVDIYTEELDVQSLSIRPARSNPVAMPGGHQPSGSTSSLLLIEASSGSFEQSPGLLEVCGSWGEGCASGAPPAKDKDHLEDQLRETLADAMIECSCSSEEVGVTGQNDNREFQGSYEELSSSSSHSGSVSHTFDMRSSPPHSMEHVLVFPSSGGSPDSS